MGDEMQKCKEGAWCNVDVDVASERWEITGEFGNSEGVSLSRFVDRRTVRVIFLRIAIGSRVVRTCAYSSAGWRSIVGIRYSGGLSGRGMGLASRRG